MGKLGLTLLPVAAQSVRQARPEQQGQIEDPVHLDRWQPDWVLFSSADKKIAIVDLCRPSDMFHEQLTAAFIRKKRNYCPLIEALGHYSALGWTISIFPWVVGIRGLVDAKHIQTTLAVLDIPKENWKEGIENTVLASVRAFSFLHRVRFGGRIDNSRHERNGENSEDDDHLCR